MIPYIVAIVVMFIFGLLGIVLIEVLRPERDNMTLYIMIAGFVATMTTSLLSLLKSQETHLSVNSRLDAFMRTAKEASRAEGVLEGQAMEMQPRVPGNTIVKL